MRREIDRLRVAWNPERAAGNPAHITVAYQDEAPDPALLADRVRLAASRTRRFRLEVGPDNTVMAVFPLVEAGPVDV